MQRAATTNAVEERLTEQTNERKSSRTFFGGVEETHVFTYKSTITIRSHSQVDGEAVDFDFAAARIGP